MFHVADSSLNLLAEWRWLLGGLPRLVGWSAAGDLFVRDDGGNVLRLDTGGGELERVAPSIEAFEHALSDPDRAAELLLLPVVYAFEARHGALGTTECLGFTTLPILGGSYTVENRYRLPVREHASFTGDLHRQLRDLPDGTAVRIKIVP
jgi:hypothetical protein